MSGNNMRQMRVMIDREGEHEASQWPSAADRQSGLLDGLGLGFILGSRTDYSHLKSPAQRQAEQLSAARALAEAARERQPTACETCACKACEEARLLPMVQRILAAAAARRAV